MKIIDRGYVESHKDEIVKAIRGGSIFIYPTDTIYGLGCNATIDSAVQKIREIKKRDTKKFSFIAPSKRWIGENCIVTIADIDKYLPGPYTLIGKKRNDRAVSPAVNSEDDTYGVRIPKHWFAEYVSEAGVPFVTTSVNVTGEPHMTTLDNVSKEVLEQVDYVVYEGEKLGPSSEKINLVS